MMRLLPSTLLLAGALVGCTPPEASISLLFPNAAAQRAVRRLRVEVYSLESTSPTGGDRDCLDFLGSAASGEDVDGTPVRGEYQCSDGTCTADWFAGKELRKVPRGRQIVYALAYASVAAEAPPILEGCTDRFDSEGGSDARSEVPVRLQLVVPASARLVKHAGDRQVGRAGDALGVPLAVRVEAEAPGRMGATYVIPGVPVRFASADPRFVLDGGGGEVEAFTGLDGVAAVGVRLPDGAATGVVVARSDLLGGQTQVERAQTSFFVSVTTPTPLRPREVIEVGDLGRPLAVGIGRITGAPAKDLAVLACDGEAAGCAPGVAARAPFGRTRVAVVADPGEPSQRVLSPSGDLGILPTGLAVTHLAGSSEDDEVVVSAARRAECQARRCPAEGPCPCLGRAPGAPCPCEGGELRVLRAGATNLEVVSRHALTSSNAVGLVPFRAAVSGQPGARPRVAVVAQGRSPGEVPCVRASQCLPYDPGRLLGCPPGESCEALDISSSAPEGFCRAHDKQVEVVELAAARLGSVHACTAPALTCSKVAGGEASQCACLDNPSNTCGDRDACGCKVPDRFLLGDLQAVVQPSGLVAGGLKGDTSDDVVIFADAGLGFLAYKEQSGGFDLEWEGQPIVNAPVHQGVVLDLDGLGETTDAQGNLLVGATSRPDLAWLAREPCTRGDNFSAACPLSRPLDEGTRGCLGVYYSDGQSSILGLRTPVRGGCRRHPLPGVPAGICGGRFNDDAHADLAVTVDGGADLWVFTGDGRGGLLDPPERIALPPGGVGGPVACADLDQDGLDDVVVVDGARGTVQVLRTAP